MELGHPLCKIPVHLLVLMEPLPEHRVVYRLAAREQKSCVILRDFHYEVGTGTVEVILLHPSKEVGSSHACEYDSVLDFQIPDFPGCE